MSDIKTDYPFPYAAVLLDKNNAAEKAEYNSLFIAAISNADITDFHIDDSDPEYVAIRFRDKETHDKFFDALTDIIRLREIEAAVIETVVEQPDAQPATLSLVFSAGEDQFPYRYEYTVPPEENPDVWADSIKRVLSYNKIQGHHLLYNPEDRVMAVLFRDAASYVTFMNIASPLTEDGHAVKATTKPDGFIL